MSLYSISAEGAEVALTAATAKTVLAVIGTSATKARIIQLGITFDGTSGSAEPVVVQVLRLTADDGTRTTTTTEKPWDITDPAAACLGRHTYTVEPTKESTPLLEWEVHPQGGLDIQFPLGRELVVPADTAKGIAIVCTAPAAVNCVPYLAWEE